MKVEGVYHEYCEGYRQNGLAAPDGTPLTKPIYNSVWIPEYHPDYFGVSTNEDRLGYLDKTGKVIVPPEYERVVDTFEDYAVLEKDASRKGAYTLVDLKNGTITDFQLPDGADLWIRDCFLTYAMPDDERYHVINFRGEEVLAPEGMYLDRVLSCDGHGYVVACNDEGECLLDENGKKLFDGSFEFNSLASGGYFLVHTREDTFVYQIK